MGLHAGITLDYQDALRSLRRFRREYEETMNLPTVARVPAGAGGGRSGANSVVLAAAKAAQREEIAIRRDTARQQMQIARDEMRGRTQIERDSARSRVQIARDAARDQARVDLELMRQKDRHARDGARAQERAAREAGRVQIQAAREAAREQLRIERETERESTRIAREAARQKADARRKAASARDDLGDRASTAATLGGGGALVGVGLALRESIRFEESFSDVSKTVDATDAQLAQIQKRLRDMAAGENAIPIDVNELNKVAAAGGQLGIATKNIASFTRTMAEMGVTTNLSSDEAATGMARLANITQMPQDRFDELGSTVVDLGNKFAANEREIMEMSLRLAGAGHQIGLTEAEILSFATTLSSVGVEAEAGGSSFSRVFVEIDKATREGGESLQNFARVSGMTAKEFKAAYEHDAAGAINSFVEGLGRIQKGGGNTFAALEKLGLGEIRVRDALLRTAGAGDMLNKSLATGEQAWKNNTALQKEAATRFGTTGSQIKITQNHLRELGIEAGDTLAPALRDVLKDVRWLLTAFQELSPEARENTVRFTLYAGVLLLVAGRVKGVVETLVLLRQAMLLSKIATLGTADAATTAAGKIGILSRTLTGLRALIATPVGKGGLIAALAALTAYGVTKAVQGVQDAGLSEEETVKRHGTLGTWWNYAGNKLATDENIGDRRIGIVDFLAGTGGNYWENNRKAAAASANSARIYAQMRADVDPFGDPDAPQNRNRSKSKPTSGTPSGAPSGTSRTNYDDLSGGETSKERSAREKSERIRQTAAEKAAAAAKKLRLDQLEDTERMYSGMADAAEQNARRQIEAINGVRDALRGFFDGIKSSFADRGKSGVVDGIIAKYERILNLGGRKSDIIGGANNAVANARRGAGEAASLRDEMQGGDGFNAQYADGGGRGTLLVARSLVGMTGRDARVARAMGGAYGEEWCVGFAQIVSQQAGQGKLARGALSVDAVRKWAKEMGRAYRGVPQIGDFATMKNVGRTRSHIGVVSKVNADGTFETVGGNEGSRNNHRSRVVEGARYRSDHRGVLFVRSGATGAKTSGSATSPVGTRYAGAFNSAMQQALETDNDGRLSSLGKLPKEWGAELSKNEKNTHRFAAQIFLLSKEGQAFARDWKKAGHSLKEFRGDMNALDALGGTLDNSKAYADKIKDRKISIVRDTNELRRALQSRGDVGSNRENNSLAQLNDRLREGEFAGVDKKTVRGLYDATRATMADNSNRVLDEANKALKERVSLLQLEEGQLKANIYSETELADRLEIEATRRARVAELVKSIPGMTQAAAIAQANEETVQQRQNKTAERRIANLREYNQLVAETASLVASNAIKATIFGSSRAGSQEQERALAFEDERKRLQDLVDGGKISKNDMFARIGEWSKQRDSIEKTNAAQRVGEAILASQNQLISLRQNLESKSLEYSFQLSDLARQELDWKYEDVERQKNHNAATAEELKTREQIRDVLRSIAQMDFSNLMQGLDDQLASARIVSPEAQERFERQRELDRNPNLSPDQRTSILRREDELSRLRARVGEERAFWNDVAQSMSGAFGDAFNTISQTSGNVFDRLKAGAFSMVDSIVQSFMNMAVEMAKNWVFQQILGMVMPGATGGAAPAASGGSASSALSMSFGGGDIGPRGLFSHENGLDRVPFDNYRANLHRGEAVLDAKDAERWNAMKRGAALSSSNTPGARGAGTSSTRSFGAVTINTYHIGTLQTQSTETIERDARRAGVTKSKSQMTSQAASFFDDY